jgi:hypothetical protein
LQFPKNLPKVNNRPIGENPPNLVTLLVDWLRRKVSIIAGQKGKS